MESLENQQWVLVNILKSVLLKIKERLFVSCFSAHTDTCYFYPADILFVVLFCYFQVLLS